jgi:alpha-tubulin suppressor-like RCC1 family protein
MKKIKISILCSLIIFCLMPVNITATVANKNHKITPMIEAETFYIAGLTDEGKIIIAGKDYEEMQKAVDDLTGVTQISISYNGLAALKSDGTVSVKMWHSGDYGQYEAENWSDIVQISISDYYIIGLKSDGTVVSTKPPSFCDYGQSEVSDWKDIVQISTFDDLAVGLKSDGTVVCAGKSEEIYQSKMSTWNDITQVEVNFSTIFGLKANGSIVITGGNRYFDDLDTWRNIVSIDVNPYHVIGIKKDGSVVIDGLCTSEDTGELFDYCKIDCYEIEKWTNIISVASAMGYAKMHYVGLKSDGTVVLGGKDSTGACEGVEEWDLISETPIGDLDGDKAVGITDIVAMAKFVHNRVPLTEETFAAADLNADNTVNAIDLSIMKWLLVKG